MQQWLDPNIGSLPALGLTSILFGLAHSPVPGASSFTEACYGANFGLLYMVRYRSPQQSCASREERITMSSRYVSFGLAVFHSSDEGNANGLLLYIAQIVFYAQQHHWRSTRTLYFCFDGPSAFVTIFCASCVMNALALNALQHCRVMQPSSCMLLHAIFQIVFECTMDLIARDEGLWSQNKQFFYSPMNN